MDWLRVAEEWLGNYGWGARGKNLGISRMFSDNDMSIIRREKLVASYRPRGILSGFLAVVPSLGHAVYLPPLRQKPVAHSAFVCAFQKLCCAMAQCFHAILRATVKC